MGSAATKIIEEALTLPADEREEVIHALLASLEPPPGVLREDDPGFWEEMDRRHDSVLDGTAKTIPWEEVRGRLRAK